MTEPAATVLYTVGHSTRSFEDLVTILKAFGIQALADVRTVPRSRRVPQFNSDSLARNLPALGIEYRHCPGLGGFRKGLGASSSNTGWRNNSFRGYADYMLTEEFRDALADLISVASRKPTVIMCAEAVPWRCHRSLIADALLIRGWTVRHLLNAGRSQDHDLTPFARVEGERITYPAVEV